MPSAAAAVAYVMRRLERAGYEPHLSPIGRGKLRKWLRPLWMRGKLLSRKLRGGALRPEDAVQLKPWGRYWEFWISVSYLNGYFDATRQSGLLPKNRDELNLLMNILLLEKAIYELSYELDNRPDWVAVPIEGILGLIKTKAVVGLQ